MRELEKRVTEITIVPKGESLFHECATRIKIDDEAGGEFVEVTQCSEGQSVSFERDEWELVKEAVNEMIAECRNYGDE